MITTLLVLSCVLAAWCAFFVWRCWTLAAQVSMLLGLIEEYDKEVTLWKMATESYRSAALEFRRWVPDAPCPNIHPEPLPPNTKAN